MGSLEIVVDRIGVMVYVDLPFALIPLQSLAVSPLPSLMVSCEKSVDSTLVKTPQVSSDCTT